MATLGPVRPDHVLLLVNPLSFRLSLPGSFSKLRQKTKALGLHPQVVYGPQEIEPLLDQAMAKGVDLIIVVGGDGTLQATVSLLASQHPNTTPPPIVVLGGGRTNYIATHLGTQSRAVAIIERALTRPESLSLTHTAVLKLSQQHQPGIYGFFVGGALVDHVIRDCHQYRTSGRGRLRQGRYSTVWRLLQLSILGLLRRVHYKSPTLTLRSDTLGSMTGRVRLLVMTTLDESQVRIHPYQKRGHGAVKLTAVCRDARLFWWHLPQLLQGRPSTRLSVDNGYFSGMSDAVTIEGLGPVCVDGQEHTLNPNQPTEVTTGPCFCFVSS